MRKILLFAAIAVVAGCGKHTLPKPLPEIVITTPVSNQHYVLGQTIHISGSVTHSLELTEVAVHIEDAVSKVEIFHNHFSAGNVLTYQYDSYYPILDNVKASYIVEVEAADLDGNTSTKEMIISVN